MTFFRKLSSSQGEVICSGISAFAILYLLVGGFVLLSAPAYAATPAEQGQIIFEQRCQSCHTIGGGRLVGPNLNGITTHRDTDWLISFITAPDKLIAEGDPIAKEIVQEYGLLMPNLGLTDDDAIAVLAYIESQSSESKPIHTHTPAQTITPTPELITATVTSDAGTGRDLFTGKLALKNGGPACFSCHNVSSVGIIGGGTVGKDLTTAYSTFSEAGITSMLKTTPFPMMKEIYTAKPLTDEEIGSVLAFLKESASTPSATSQNPSLFFIIGGAGALLIVGALQWLWRGRLAGVRRQLVRGGSK